MCVSRVLQDSSAGGVLTLCSAARSQAARRRVVRLHRAQQHVTEWAAQILEASQSYQWRCACVNLLVNFEADVATILLSSSAGLFSSCFSVCALRSLGSYNPGQAFRCRKAFLVCLQERWNLGYLPGFAGAWTSQEKMESWAVFFWDSSDVQVVTAASKSDRLGWLQQQGFWHSLTLNCFSRIEK